MDDSLRFRREVLKSFGASEAVTEELLAYNANVFGRDELQSFVLPMEDEPFVETWKAYALECENAGDILPLWNYLVQLSFPIEEGISQNSEYLAATRRGQTSPNASKALQLRHPEQCRLILHRTLAGRIPVLLIEDREDFQSLVRALSKRNEPTPIPPSMGACMIAGLNNWHRVRLARKASEQLMGTPLSEADWQVEFQKLIPQRERYQDRLVILSTGPYSGVPAERLGLDASEWLSVSRIIRLEHECTHYTTKRLFGSMKNNLLDELIADFMGILAANGKFRADWLLAFWGTGGYPQSQGRIGNYLGDPPLSEPAMRILILLVERAAEHLELFCTSWSKQTKPALMQAGALLTLTSVTIEEVAARDAVPTLLSQFHNYLSKITFTTELTQ